MVSEIFTPVNFYRGFQTEKWSITQRPNIKIKTIEIDVKGKEKKHYWEHCIILQYNKYRFTKSFIMDFPYGQFP